MTVTIEKVWDENERTHEAPNGRLYVSRGRWQWLVLVNGEVVAEFDRKRDATAHIADLPANRRTP